jgi:hypothetical protein
MCVCVTCSGADGRDGEAKQPPQTINILTHGTVPIVHHSLTLISKRHNQLTQFIC